jgi:hypothetical protein
VVARQLRRVPRRQAEAPRLRELLAHLPPLLARRLPRRHLSGQPLLRQHRLHTQIFPTRYDKIRHTPWSPDAEE